MSRGAPLGIEFDSTQRPIPVRYVDVLSADAFDRGTWIVARWKRGGYLVAGWAVMLPEED